MPRNGQWIRPLRRRAIHLRDGGVCVYCDVRVDTGEPRLATLDHVYARNDHDYRNLVTACHGCNSRRQQTPFDVWVTDKKRRKRIHDLRYRGMDPFILQARIELEIEARVTRRTLVPEDDVERIVWARIRGLVDRGALAWVEDPDEIIPEIYRQDPADVPF